MVDNGIKPSLGGYCEQPSVQVFLPLPSLLDHLYQEKKKRKEKSQKRPCCD